MRLNYEYRQKVTEFINRNLPKAQSSMLCGMLFGDKSGMDENDKTLFYRTGIGHVMAVSGLHLVLFCGIFSFIFDKIKLGRIKRFVFLEILMAVFAISSGLSDSVLRASLMMTLLNLAPLFFRKADTLNSIGAAFIILTLINPFSITNPSLVLSVTGTFGAGVFAPFLTKNMKENTFIKRQFKNAVYMCLVSLAVTPFSLIFFGESSFVSPVANVFLTPLCIAALFLAIIVSLTLYINPVFLIKAAGALCELVMLCVRFIGKLKFSGMNFGSEIKYISAAVVLLCAVVFLTFRTRKSLVISVIASAVGFVVFSSVNTFVNSDKLSIALLGDKGIDVIAVVKGGHADIIDISGRKKNPDYALKFLQQNNISSVDSIIIKSNPLQAMSAYDNGFELVDTDSVILPEDTFIRDDMTVCGEKPEFSDFENFAGEWENIRIQINDTRIFIKYGDFEFVCDSVCNDTEAMVYAEYENIFNPPKARALIVPEYENTYGFENLVTERNVHIIADEKGDFRIGGL